MNAFFFDDANIWTDSLIPTIQPVKNPHLRMRGLRILSANALNSWTRKRRRESVYLCYRPIFSNDLPPISLRGRFVGLKERDQLKLH